MKHFCYLVLFLCSISWAQAQTPYGLILNERDRATVIDDILEERIDELLPEIMQRSGIDMWLIISREYNEDPVMKTMLPSKWLSARRRTIFVFAKNDDGSIDRIAIARYGVGKLLKGEWNIDVYPNQWDALTAIIKKKNPKKIGLNYSQYFGLADGLVHSEHKELLAHLPDAYKDRIVSAEKLAIGWLETRTEKEIQLYSNICRIAHRIVRRGLSEEFIHPGITTTADIEWNLRDLVRKARLDTWFHPSVSVQRQKDGNKTFLQSFSRRAEEDVIQYGDLIHVDFGITYLRLNTDQQEHFYVLKPGETEAPKGLQQAFKAGKRLQDILTSNFKIGISGNDLLQKSLDQAKAEGITASIYTHPIGYHGHAAGPTIGMWDQQNGVKGNGDYTVHHNTAYSIELFAASEIPEWNNQIVRIMLEQDGVFAQEGFYYLDGRQEELHLIHGN